MYRYKPDGTEVGRTVEWYQPHHGVWAASPTDWYNSLSEAELAGLWGTGGSVTRSEHAEAIVPETASETTPGQ